MQQQPAMKAAGHWGSDGHWYGPNNKRGHHHSNLHGYKTPQGFVYNGYYYPPFPYVSNQQNMQQPMMQHHQQQQQQPSVDMSGNNLNDIYAQQQQFSLQNANATPTMQQVACPPSTRRISNMYDEEEDDEDDDEEPPHQEDEYESDDEMMPSMATPMMQQISAQPLVAPQPSLQQPQMQPVQGGMGGYVASRTVKDVVAVGGVSHGHMESDKSHMRFVTVHVQVPIPPAVELETQWERLIERGLMDDDGNLIASLANEKLLILTGNHKVEIQKAIADSKTDRSSTPVFPCAIELMHYHNSHPIGVMANIDGIYVHKGLAESENMYPTPFVNVFMGPKQFTEARLKETLLDRCIDSKIINFLRTHPNINIDEIRAKAMHDKAAKVFRMNRMIKGKDDEDIPITQASLLAELYEAYEKGSPGFGSTERSLEIEEKLFENILRRFEQELKNTETALDLKDLSVTIVPQIHNRVLDANADNYYEALWYNPINGVTAANTDRGHSITLTYKMYYVSTNTQ